MASAGVKENLNIRNVSRLENKNEKPGYGSIQGRTHVALNSLDKQELVL